MTAASWLIDDTDKMEQTNKLDTDLYFIFYIYISIYFILNICNMEQTNRLDTNWGQKKFFEAPLVSFEDLGIKSTRNKWRTSVMLSELCPDVYDVPRFASEKVIGVSLIHRF